MFYHGWINTDIINLQEFASRYRYKFMPMDVKNPLPFNNEVIDLAYSSHMLEHLSVQEGINFLSECYRCMKKGGVLRLAVPDAAKLISYYQANQLTMFDEINDNCATNEFETGKLWSLLFDRSEEHTSELQSH